MKDSRLSAEAPVLAKESVTAGVITNWEYEAVADPAGLNEVTMEELIIPATGHKDGGESKPEESKTEVSKTEESKPEESKTEVSKTEESKSEDSKPEESRAVVIRNSESKTVESSTSKSIPVASSDNNAPETGDNTAYAAIALASVMSVLAVFVILGRRDKTNK